MKTFLGLKLYRRLEGPALQQTKRPRKQSAPGNDHVSEGAYRQYGRSLVAAYAGSNSGSAASSFRSLNVTFTFMPILTSS